jgi:hypothetical protein
VFDLVEPAGSERLTGQSCIHIENQSPYSVQGKPPSTVLASRTSMLLAKNWIVALGDSPSGIANLTFRRGASDAGSHHFASSVSAIEAYWNRRGDPGRTTSIAHKVYNTALMNEQLSCLRSFSGHSGLINCTGRMKITLLGED